MIRLIGVPVDSVGAPAPDGSMSGTEHAPAALRRAGLIEILGAVDAGDLDVRITNRIRDPETGVLGWPDVHRTTSAVRTAVIAALHNGDLPVVIGGCCTVLPGALAGARDALGVVGLAYVDGHLDLYDGRTSPTGEPADMAVSVITGAGPEAWADLVGAPLTPIDGLALLGPRDRAEARQHGSVLPEQLGLSTEFDPETIRDLGAERTGVDTEQALTATSEAFWIHLDVDVLDPSDMPATDYVMPGGLDWQELADLLRPLGRSASCVGFSLGCYNPDKDPDNSSAERLASLIGDVLIA